MHRLWIPGPLPGLNEIISAKGAKFRSGYDGYSSLKKKWAGSISLLAQTQGFPKLDSGHFIYLWREKDRRRDPSNFTAGGRKIIEDALQGSGLLPNDGWGQVLSVQDHWVVDPERPGVSVYVSDELHHNTAYGWTQTDKEMRDAKKSG